MRTVEIDLGEGVTLYDVVQRLVDNRAVYPGPDVERAFGYLAMWNASSFPRCVIRLDGEYDFVATYYRPDGVVGYAIGAVWSGNGYGFHS